MRFQNRSFGWAMWVSLAWLEAELRKPLRALLKWLHRRPAGLQMSPAELQMTAEPRFARRWANMGKKKQGEGRGRRGG